MVYRYFKDLPRRTESDKVLRYKAFEVFLIQSMMDINVKLHHWSTNVLIKRLEKQKLKYVRFQNWPINYINLSLEKLKCSSYNYLIQITFEMLILQT